MSASWYWRPVSERKQFNPGLSDTFKKLLDQLCVAAPGLLTKADLPRLYIAKAAAEGDLKDAIIELISAVEQHSDIKIEVEY